ncbi:MAG: helix-turn-helix transcriptional regulator [Anaerolineales bacterium]
MADQRALSLRTKMLGAMVREARNAAGMSIRDSAEFLGIGTSTFSSYEHGRKGISLPELEALAFAYRVPLESFWDWDAGDFDRQPSFDPHRGIALRQRLIGAQLRKHRQEADISIKDLANSVDFPPSRISAYERGQRTIPLPELEVMAGALGHRMDDYIELDGPIGDWIRDRQLFDQFRALDPELRSFVADPDNRDYLALASSLSRLPEEELRTIRRTLDQIIP